MSLFEYIGNRIRDLRSSYGGGQGLSQEALAKAVGLAPNTISRWETATYKPSIEDLEKLARFFSVPMLSFFPPQEAPADDKVTALLRAAKDLPENDIDELRQYAEFRRARYLYEGGTRPKAGRKRKG